jgi:hypothetical protein
MPLKYVVSFAGRCLVPGTEVWIPTLCWGLGALRFKPAVQTLVNWRLRGQVIVVGRVRASGTKGTDLGLIGSGFTVPLALLSLHRRAIGNDERILFQLQRSHVLSTGKHVVQGRGQLSGSVASPEPQLVEPGPPGFLFLWGYIFNFLRRAYVTFLIIYVCVKVVPCGFVKYTK